MTTEELIEESKTRPEPVWHWGERLVREDAESFAAKGGFSLDWGEPIRPSDLYIAKRNSGWHLLTCRKLGKAYVVSVEGEYPYDFSECVKVKP